MAQPIPRRCDPRLLEALPSIPFEGLVLKGNKLTISASQASAVAYTIDLGDYPEISNVVAVGPENLQNILRALIPILAAEYNTYVRDAVL